MTHAIINKFREYFVCNKLTNKNAQFKFYKESHYRMMEEFNLDELTKKVPDLESELCKVIEKPVKCYFYIYDVYEKITLLIFEPAPTPDGCITHRIYIHSDTRCITESLPTLILQKIELWLDKFSVVKRRQLERTRQFKHELIIKYGQTFNPDRSKVGISSNELFQTSA
jgi:hypothetical protein